ncbi:DNA translocase FtsK [Lentilactobacillus parafarraginis]|uniref:DNA translocase FtsK n=1 Tax=Lentilactobacillus parafarraginis TaxID=390842 RepID=A0A5R9CZE9_9LACO|nr:DNA translocase FtsK [Lentilactobacillus parafarraginis]TLQ20582.1 DNA translocase FtsK [Lentilactobacillus parafarraginis]
MKYYDGPAFFRRRDLIQSRTPKKVKNEQEKVPRRPTKPRDLSTSSTKFTDSRVTDDNTPAFLKEIRNFVPHTHDVNTNRRKQKRQIETNYVKSQKQRRTSRYARIIDALRISDDDLIVLAPNQDDGASDFKEIQATALNSQTARPKVPDDAHEPSLTDQRDLQPRSIRQEVPNLGSNSHSANDHDDAPSDHQRSEKVESTDWSTKTESKSHDFSTPPAVTSNDSTPASSAANHAHKGLGQSLNAIVKNEKAVAPDIALFSKAPNSATDAEKPRSPRVPTVQPSRSLTTRTFNNQTSKMNQIGSASQPVPARTNDAQKHLATTVSDENAAGYHFPSPTLLSQPQTVDEDALDDWIEGQIDTLDKTLAAFKVDAQVVDWTNGPTVTQFQVKLALGVKVSRITNLTDDLKLALAAKDIRIEAPIPGKSTVGIEIPNPHPRPVLLSEIISAPNFKQNRSPLTTAMGVDLSGNPRIADVRKMPHGLIAGATGSGKSVFINSLLVSLLYKATPAELKLLLIDPKAVELAPYDGIPHLLSPVISDPKSASAALHWVTEEMDERYEKLSAAGVKNIEQFNQKANQSGEYGLKMPYILVIIDELADLMMVASSEVEDYIVRITQKARAAGIHLIVATQRPSVDIVTGTIKNNIPSRIAFMVSSQIDSRTILDSAGAERLLGRGDMLYLGNGANQPVRLQGAFVTNQELEKVIDFVREQGHPKYLFTPDSLKKAADDHESQDRLVPQVMKFIAQEDTISTSKLQRVFSIGYNRAANIIDSLQDRNLISEQRGSKPRTVYYHSGDDSGDESEDAKE